MEEDNFLRVVVYQNRTLKTIKKRREKTREQLDNTISQSEALLEELSISFPDKPQKKDRQRFEHPPKLRPWEEIRREAQAEVEDSFDINEVLNTEEIERAFTYHKNLETEFKKLKSLDRYDYILSGTAGILAGLIDIFLVQVPQYNVGPYGSEGGWLSNFVKENFGKVLDDERIKKLENLYKVPYDVSTNHNLEHKVAGLGPHTHRYQSLGHDPILGFIFGVKDLLYGEFTALDKYGNIIVQNTSESAFKVGENIIFRIISALTMVTGHLISDISTKKGLPAPLMSLFSFIQTGMIGNSKFTISDISRQMYYKGYDFRHFIASSFQVLLIEVIIRIGFFVKSIHHGKTLKESIPIGRDSRLQTQLFLANSVAVSMNVGKITVTKNPLSLNWPQWLAFFRYLIPQITWVLWRKENERHQFVMDCLESDREDLLVQINKTWDDFFSHSERITL